MATKAALSTIAPLTTEQAAAAIVKLINTRPDSPRHDEIEAVIARVAGGPALPAVMAFSEQQAQMHEAIQHLVGIEKAMNADDYREGLEEPHHQAFCRVKELEQQIPSPAQSRGACVLHAQAAWALADKDDDGLLCDIDEPGAEGAAARTIAAVLEFAGISCN